MRAKNAVVLHGVFQAVQPSAVTDGEIGYGTRTFVQPFDSRGVGGADPALAQGKDPSEPNRRILPGWLARNRDHATSRGENSSRL